MATDEAKLIVALEARVDRFEKAFKRADRTANDNFQNIERRAKRSGEEMEKAMAGSAVKVAEGMEKMFAPFLRGGVVFAGVAGAAMALKSVANSIAEVDREARKAGVTAQTWQQWSYVATAAGASVEGITDALKEMNIRANEFALTGKGSGAEWFDRLGYSADEVGRKLQDPNRFLDELISKIQKLDSGSQIRALDELFGGTGAEQLSKVLGLSVEQIQQLRSEAATFSDEQIAAAKKIDAEFETLWRNVRVYAKQAAIEGVGYAQKIIGALQGKWLPGYDRLENTQKLIHSPEFQIEQLKKQRAQLLKDIDAAKADPNIGGLGTLEALQKELADTEEQIIALGGGSKELKAAMKELSDMTQKAGGTFDGAATSAANFKSAIADLKALVPELKAELDTLAKTDAVDTAFSKAFDNAKNLDDLISAGNLAARAKSVARYGDQKNILDLIGAAEGTDKGRGYNETLGYGKFTGGAVNLTGMSIDQVLALQGQMLAQTRALPKDSPFYNSSAVGRYQITRRTLKSLVGELGLTGDRLFDDDTQDELARALLRRRGNNPANLRNEWEGLRGVDDSTISRAYNGTPVAAQKLAPTDAQQRQTDLLNQQTEARKRLNQAIDEGLNRAQFEQSISGMSEQQKQLELTIYDAVLQAKRDGIQLSDQEIQKIREKIAETQRLNGETRNTSLEQKNLADAGQFFEQQIGGALMNVITGAQSAQEAIQQLLASIGQALLQAALLGTGPLGGLVGGKGIFAGVFAADGGYISGPGTSTSDSIPARLSDGEFVVNAMATTKHRPLLEAVNSGRVLSFAKGGGVDGKQGTGLVVGNTSNVFSAPITINVEGGSRGKEADTEFANKLGQHVEDLLDTKMSEFASKQMRNGGMFNRGSLA